MKRYRLAAIPILSLAFATLACIPPQDCGGSDFSVKGQVSNKAGEPVSGATIRAYGYECYEAEAFKFTVASDANGYFESEEIFRFACCEFNVEISAAGYTTRSFVFYPQGEQWPDELPKELVVTLQTE